MTQLHLVPKRDPTRHDLEQQLDSLAREYGVSKEESFRADARSVQQMEVLKTKAPNDVRVKNGDLSPQRQ
jgi:hypothetical protein